MHEPEATGRGVVCDLPGIERELRLEPSYTQIGHAARALIRTEDLRAVFVVMRAGSLMHEHRVNDTALVQVTSGLVRFRLAARTFELQAGQLLILDAGVRHDVSADSDSAFMLTFGWRGAGAQS